MQQDKKIEELQDTDSEMRTMISQHEAERSEMRTMILDLHASLLPRSQGGAQARLKFRCEKNFTFFDNRTLRLCSVLPHLGTGVLVLSCSTLAPDRGTIPILPSLAKHLILSTFFSCSCEDAPRASRGFGWRIH